MLWEWRGIENDMDFMNLITKTYLQNSDVII
jgi:hypothetical protein